MTNQNALQSDLIPLVMTPAPHPSESVLGFILRTSAQNGFLSPNKMLRYAGMTENEIRSARPPLDKLARLYGRSKEELRFAGLDATDLGYNARQIPLLGHTIHSMFTRCKHAGVCVDCVREHGFVEAYQELKYAVACPIHSIKTLYQCPICQHSLDWQRPDLNRCRCGADLGMVKSEVVTDANVLALLEVMRNKLLNLPPNAKTLNSLGFAIEGLQGMSLNTLLSVIYRFGLFNLETASLNSEWDAVVTAAKVLSNWPYQFHEYLAEVHAPKAKLEVSGLRGQYNRFYESFFKSIEDSKSLRFIRDAFMQYGQEHCSQIFVHPNLGQQSSGIFGMQQLAAHIGVQPSTLRKLIQDGHIRVDTKILKATRKSLVLSPQQPFAFATGLRLSLRQAAQRLDIPVNILRSYRALGLYQAKYLVVPIQLFHERDVDTLHQDLMQGLKASNINIESHHITLDAIMRMKVSAEVKALWLDAVRNRKISAIAALSNLPSGLVFDQATVKNFIERIASALENTISLHEVKYSLGLNAKGLFSLVSAGYLKTAYEQTYGLRITEESYLAIRKQSGSIRKLVLAEQLKALSWHQLKIPLMFNVQEGRIKKDILLQQNNSKPFYSANQWSFIKAA